MKTSLPIRTFSCLALAASLTAVVSIATATPPTPDDTVTRARQHAALIRAARSGTSLRASARPAIQFTSPGLPGFDGAIDAFWGPGLPTARKLQIFDQFWQTIDSYFACFQGIEDVDWAGLRERYRPQVAAGVSRGRFAGIMNHLSIALRESHTQALDAEVNEFTLPQPGVPLVWIGPWGNNTFGACATAQDDGSALIFEVPPGHPLGLKPGDRVLGFDGHPWTELYPQLLNAELPLYAFAWWGSSPSSFRNILVGSAPLNWYLFQTVDIAKYGTGEIQHLPTSLLQNAPATSFCSEQMDLAGIAKPQIVESNFENVVSWGVLPGTRIGYIYVWGWFGDAGPKFSQAIRELTQQQQTDGLIIDFRFNLGGSIDLSNEGLGLLFDQPTPTIGFAERSNPSDHFKMRTAAGSQTQLVGMPGFYVIPSTPHTSYNRPIAVLVGPGAVSAGDQNALRMTYLPHARTFGRSTATAFNAPVDLYLDPDWSARFALIDAFRVGNPKNFLTHDEFVVDEPVWLRPDDVAAGRDTVVEAALRWIESR
jgi:hypothetical protein